MPFAAAVSTQPQTAAALQEVCPRVRAALDGPPGMGGRASGIRGPGQARRLLDGVVHADGAVGVLLQGPLGLRPIVSQGCRPIGKPLVVTKARDNVVIELGGKPAMDQLRQIW